MRSIELYTGAGGLAMGISRAGFTHLAVVERDADSCKTLHENKRRRVEEIHRWPVFNCDVKCFDFGSIPEGIELFAAEFHASRSLSEGSTKAMLTSAISSRRLSM